MREVQIREGSIWVHDNEDLSNHIVRESDFFEIEILDFIKRHFPNHRIILDIGANIGNHTLYFSRFLKHTYIYAFEPVPENFEVLEKNCAGLPDIFLSTVALSDKAETIPMSANTRNMGMSSYDINGKIQATAYPLDMYEFEDVSLIKIDVENYEPQVLAGAAKTIQRNKPLILIEDNYNQYESLLPDYEIIAGWEGSKTYLYKWKD